MNYRLEGVNGEAVFHWDNTFAGSNSADGSAPAGYRIEQIGDTGNRTLVFFSIHASNKPAVGAVGGENQTRPVSETAQRAAHATQLWPR